MVNTTNVAKSIKQIREKLNLSRSEFAELLGISVSAVAMYETGELIPRDETKYKISRLAGETVDSIFFKE